MQCTQTHSTNNLNVINARVANKHPELKIEGCMRLAAAIIESAYRDYVNALKKIKKIQAIHNPTIKDRNALINALKEKIECEEFYKSRRFQILTLGNCKLTPDEVMRKIRIENGIEE